MKEISTLLKKTLTAFALLIIVGCSNSLSPEEYNEWYADPENGLVVKQVSKPFVFEAFYRPAPLLALQNFGGKIPGPAELEAELKELEKFQYFNVRVSTESRQNFLKANIRNQEEYFQRVAYFSSFAQPDFKLVDGGDTLSCSIYHFERSYGISPYNTILLGFENPHSKPRNKELIYEDRILGLAPLTFKIEASALQNLPKLKP